MRYQRILFCIPPFLGSKPRNPFTGVGYLSAFLDANSIANDVIDMNLGYNASKLYKKIESFHPDLIGLFLMTHNYKNSYKLINDIKSKFKLDVVVGGPHVSIMREEVLRQSQADYAVKLEGEYTLKELMGGDKLENIPGLIYRCGEIIVENRDREFIRDIDSIPFPTYQRFELHKYYGNSIPIVSSRGCPYGCVYCPVKSAIGRHFRARSAENVVREIEYWHERGYRFFEFMDDNFTLLRQRVVDFCSLLRSKKLKDIVLICPNGIRADRVDRELLAMMRKTGFQSLSFGVEAGNDRILKNLKKSETIEVIERAIKDACDLDFNVTLFFLTGSPGETRQDVEDSVKLALKYPVNNVFFYSLVPYPKTELYEWVKQNSYFLKDPGEYLSSASANESEIFFATPEFPEKERKAVLVYTRKIQKQVLLASIRRRFFKNSFVGKILAPLILANFMQLTVLKWKVFWKFYNRYLVKKAQ